MLLKDLVEDYVLLGFQTSFARVKVCQEILFQMISESEHKDIFTIKGGTIMYQLTKQKRRATADLDLDFIRTSIAADSIIQVFSDLDKVEDDFGIGVSVKENTIKKLKHAEYKGKSIVLVFSDSSADTLELKLDIGVHKNVSIKQNTLQFDVNGGRSKVELLVNPPEQMIVEKTVSFINTGVRSFRFKDVFDIYYLISKGINKSKLKENIRVICIEKDYVKTSDLKDYKRKMMNFFRNDETVKKLKASNNWLNKDEKEILNYIGDFFEKNL